MYSLSARFNQICYFTSFTLLIASAVNQLTAVYMFNGEPSVSFNVVAIDRLQKNIEILSISYNNTQRHYNGGYQRWEQMNLRFDLEANLEPIFNWNLRQVFLYVNVHFVNKEKFSSDCIIFDEIITRPSNPSDWPQAALFRKKSAKSEYPLRDLYYTLRGQNVTFEVWVEILPQIGIIYSKKLYEFPYTLPTEYK